VAVWRSIVLNRVRRGIAGGHDERSSVKKITAQVSTFVHVKDRLRVAICEPVEVDDYDVIFGRQQIDNTKRIFVR